MAPKSCRWRYNPWRWYLTFSRRTVSPTTTAALAPRAPFCDTEGLANIIQRDGDCIWLENKFKTLWATRQTVLIESANHDADLVTYEPDELHHVMRFALGCWQQMIDS